MAAGWPLRSSPIASAAAFWPSRPTARAKRPTSWCSVLTTSPKNQQGFARNDSSAVRRAILFAAPILFFCVQSFRAITLFNFPQPITLCLNRGSELKFFAPTAPDKPWMSGSFGCVRSYGSRMHEGLDIRHLQTGKRGEPTDPIMATADGTVVYFITRPSLSNYGNYIVIRHVVEGMEIYSLYAHLSAIRPGLKIGEQVKAGEVIATMGHTSNTAETIAKWRAHVHFELNVLVNDSFAAWFKKNSTERNDHGEWNGQNLNGLDPREILLDEHAPARHEFQPAEFYPQPDGTLPRARARDKFSLFEALPATRPEKIQRQKKKASLVMKLP